MSPVESVVTGLLQKSRKGIMDGLRKFIDVEVGGLRQGVTSFQVVLQKFAVDSPEAIIREGSNELTLRAEEEGAQRSFFDTKHVMDRRCGPPLVDADWHAFCQAIYQGIEGQEWEAMYYHLQELYQTVRTKKPGKRLRRIFMTQLIIKIFRTKNPNPPRLVGRTLDKSSGCPGEGALEWNEGEPVATSECGQILVSHVLGCLCPCPRPDGSQQSKYEESAESLGRAL